MNQVCIIGNVCNELELKETSSGIPFCGVSVAVNRPYLEDGERKVDFFNITVWRKQAENCAKYLRKGSKISIVGSLQTRSFEDKDGQKRTKTEIIPKEIEFLSVPQNDGSQDETKPSKPKQQSISGFGEVDEEDLPF